MAIRHNGDTTNTQIRENLEFEIKVYYSKLNNLQWILNLTYLL